jgi:hypothetical protein
MILFNAAWGGNIGSGFWCCHWSSGGWRAGSRPWSSDRRGNRDIRGSCEYTSAATGHLFRLPSLRISRIRISRLRAVGLWVPRPLGIPRLLRSSGLWIPRLFGSARFPRTPALWIPRLFGSARFPRTPALWIPRLLGTTSLPRLTELWKPEPTAVLSLLRFRISRGWLSGRSPSGGLVARSRVRHRAFKLSFGLKFGIRNYANA